MMISDIYNKSGKRFGYRQVTDSLKNQYNLHINHKKVQRIMRENGLKSIVRPKYKLQDKEKCAKIGKT